MHAIAIFFRVENSECFGLKLNVLGLSFALKYVMWEMCLYSQFPKSLPIVRSYLKYILISFTLHIKHGRSQTVFTIYFYVLFLRFFDISRIFSCKKT